MKILNSLKKIAIIILIIAISIFFDRFFSYLISNKENIFKDQEVIVYESYLSKNSSVCLYPGYLTKLNGQILWHPQKPGFNDINSDWNKDKSVDVTGCIFDPWPFTQGNKDLLIEITN